MLFLTLLACYERVLTDARIDVRKEVVHVLSQQQGVDDQIEGAACTDVAGCLAALTNHLAEERSQLAAMAATDIVNGFYLRDGELDLVVAYTAPLSSELFAGGAPLQRVAAEVNGKQRVFAVVRQPLPDENARMTVSATGPHARLSLAEDGDLWTFTRGRPRVHLTYQNVRDGVDLVIDPWIQNIPGLEAALRADPRFLDPAGLRP